MDDAYSDFKCPRCRLDLKAQSTSVGKVWICDACNGQAVGLALLRQSFTEESINRLWENAVDGHGKSVCECPACNQAMKEVNASPDLRVDVCCRCHFVWLDSGEVERFARRPQLARPHGLPDKAQEILGKALMKQVELKAEMEAAAELLRDGQWFARGDDYPFQYLLSLLWRLRK